MTILHKTIWRFEWSEKKDLFFLHKTQQTKRGALRHRISNIWIGITS